MLQRAVLDWKNEFTLHSKQTICLPYHLVAKALVYRWIIFKCERVCVINIFNANKRTVQDVSTLLARLMMIINVKLVHEGHWEEKCVKHASIHIQNLISLLSDNTFLIFCMWGDIRVSDCPIKSSDEGRNWINIAMLQRTIFCILLIGFIISQAQWLTWTLMMEHVCHVWCVL